MDLIQLIYHSQPFGFDASTLNGILFKARANNARDGITGTLICRQDMFLQLLEGPEKAVDAAYARIADDDRHIEVRQRRRQPAETRMFPEWAMRDDPVRSWMWTEQEIEAGALSDASEDEIVAVFERILADPAEAGARTAY